MRRLLGLAVVWGSLFVCGVASAEPRAGTAEDLHAEARSARTWRYTWVGVNGGLMVGAFAMLPLVERENRPDWIISGIGSGVTLLATWLWPLNVEGADEELSALPAAERSRRLPRLLHDSAEDEQARVTWPWHAANVGLSLGTGAIIAFGYQHYASGAITAVAGTALGEVQILTQPTGLPLTCPGACRVMPRLAFTPRCDALPATWTLSVAGALE